MFEMFLSLVLFTVGEMLFMPLSVALCYSFGSDSYKGIGIGAWRSAYALGMMIGPLLSGFAMHYSNSKMAWLLSASLCLLGAVLVVLSGRVIGKSETKILPVTP